MSSLSPSSLARLVPPASRLYPALKGLSVVLGAIIVVLSLIPNPPGGAGGGPIGAFLSRLVFGTDAYADKAAHFLAYAALAGTALIAWGRHRRAAAWTLLLLLGLGATLELLQAAGGVRTGDLTDMLANGVGVAAGTAGGAATRLGIRALGLSPR